MIFSIFNTVVKTIEEIIWVLLNHDGTAGTNGKVPVDIPVGSALGKLTIGVEVHPPTTEIVKNTKPSLSLHALVIGINDYKSSEVPNLRGAVADADAFSEYLTNHLNVPRSQITNLRDAEAIRDNIISSIRNLGRQDDGRIKRGDSILIFYAGHGSSARAPAGWVAGSNKIQFIVPHDCRVNVWGSKVPAIPDRTLGALLRQLADVKGDNITVILDCCHSGSGTRKDEVINPTRISRGFELLAEEVPFDLDQAIWQAPTQGRSTAIASGFANAGLRSHVLLAACGADETASEEAGRGIFSSTLLDVLHEVGANSITYKDLLRRIPHLPGQNPQCEGVNVDRFLFNGLVPNPTQKFYHIHREGEQYILDAGEVHGIADGMEFAVYPSRNINTSKPSGALRSALDLIKPFRSELLLLGASPHFDIPANSLATPTRAGESQGLRLHIPMDSELVPAFQAVAQQFATRRPGQPTIVLVEKDKAEVSLALTANGRIEFQLGDCVTTGYGLTKLYHTVAPRFDEVEPVIPAAAHFFWHLRRQPAKSRLQKMVDVLFHEIVETDEFDDNLLPVMKASDENLNVGGVVDVEADDATFYGMTIKNKSSVELYISAFYFDCSDLSITSYYMPPTATATSKVDPPLSPRGSLPIGHGAGGSPPSQYHLSPNQNRDVGFIKVFISTHAVDLSSIPQASPFRSGARHVHQTARLPPPMWDVVTLALIQWPKGTTKVAMDSR